VATRHRPPVVEPPDRRCSAREALYSACLGRDARDRLQSADEAQGLLRPVDEGPARLHRYRRR
jgi:hypothetical protein